MRQEQRQQLRGRSVWLATLVAVVMALVVAGCGTEEAPEASGGESKGELNTAWLWYGPKNDGGWNLASSAAQDELKSEFGNAYSQSETDNVPYSEEAAQIAEQFVAEGANVIIDVVGLAEILTKVCQKHPDLACIQTAAVGELPENVQGYFARAWITNYTAGVAAGLMTESNTVGFISAYDIPLIIGGLNSFTMGCRSVNPECQVRNIAINEYFSPPKTAQAANTLVDAGADVIRGWIDDPSYCAVTKKRNVLAVVDFWDASEQCGDSIITSTVFNFTDFYVEQLRQVRDGSWKGGGFTWVPNEQVFSLGEWGPRVPDDVRSEVEETLDKLISGESNPWTGPIKDASGKVRVQDGEELTDEFLYGGWKWKVEGVVSRG